MRSSALLHQALEALVKEHPYLHDFFAALDMDLPRDNSILREFILSTPPEHLARYSLTHETLMEQVLDFIAGMVRFQAEENENNIRQVTILAGHDKSGNKEASDLVLCPGEVVCIVGPTGSGKSRLLADIECLARADTPSGRRILLNGSLPDPAMRFSGERQLVAQLSQNMNFVMDMTVEEFLNLHAESRLIQDAPARVRRIFEAAVGLAGEPFSLATPVTALSGGQSRALMIADVAFLSASPIVLIDEIENAGVDRRKALALLIREEKIVLMATHDPMLALSGHRRIVIRNGGMVRIIQTSEAEKRAAARLEVLDQNLGRLRDDLRQGRSLVFDPEHFLTGRPNPS
ncbi:ATP-binding cassette domain-containing protein [Desulfospira joergensenii]|uniref:ATP-binding cassette domain-containing protein n=1 Tax=Desulfospira joergensenii TaxID=53329 RepID=UPI0003B7B679|nr:ATP-binding cassette domain-containing protein [Desulfospira joergensenii]